MNRKLPIKRKFGQLQLLVIELHTHTQNLF